MFFIGHPLSQLNSAPSPRINKLLEKPASYLTTMRVAGKERRSLVLSGEGEFFFKADVPFKVDVPVLGVVENMALHVCSQCGHQEHIFGSGGGQRIANEYHTTLLGSLPLDVAIREDVDAGKPTVVAQPDSPTALCYRNIARHLAARVWEQTRANSTPVPEIVISND
jgi:hypothetical protein